MKENKQLIGLDLDDVIIDFNEGLMHYHNALYGTSYTRKDITSWALENTWGCTTNEAIQRVYDFYHSEEHGRCPAVRGAVDMIHQLSVVYSITVITSRPENVRELTTNWLNQHVPDILGEIHFLGHYHGPESRRKSKGEVCKELGVGLFIEDSLANAENVAEQGIPVLLFDKPWNQGDLPPNTIRMYSWEGIREMLLYP